MEIAEIEIVNQHGRRKRLPVYNSGLVNLGAGLVPVKEIEAWAYTLTGERWWVTGIQREIFQEIGEVKG